MSEPAPLKQPNPAAAHALDPLLAPRSIAFLGASQRPNTPGNDMVREAVAGGFDGALYPINPRYSDVEGLSCFPSIDDLPETVDHVVLCVASEKIEDALGQVIRHGARATTIFASCHSEQDREPALSKRIAAMAREAGVAICGGNCMGFVNQEIGLRVAAYPCHTNTKVGPITWIAQSGSVYGALAFNDRRLKFNLCVSSGGEFVTRSSDYLEWALRRKSTGVVGLFLESIRDPEGFEAALANAARREIPVVVLRPAARQAPLRWPGRIPARLRATTPPIARSSIATGWCASRRSTNSPPRCCCFRIPRGRARVVSRASTTRAASVNC